MFRGSAPAWELPHSSKPVRPVTTYAGSWGTRLKGQKGREEEQKRRRRTPVSLLDVFKSSPYEAPLTKTTITPEEPVQAFAIP